MQRRLTAKQVIENKRSRYPMDNIIIDRANKRAELQDEVHKFLARGGVVQEVPIGTSGIKGHVFAQYAKGQKNGLKQIVIKKER